MSQTTIPDLKVILYSGQNDIICSTSGTLNYLYRLDWQGIKPFINARKQVLKVQNGTIAGNYKHHDKLTFAVIYDAGHMVPLDQPNSARTMLEMFIENQFGASSSNEKLKDITK